VKELLILILLAATVGLYFHDKQQTSELEKAQSDNAQLSEQLTNYETSYNALLAKTQKFNSVQFNDAPRRQPGGSALSTGHVQGSGDNPLDRPAY